MGQCCSQEEPEMRRVQQATAGVEEKECARYVVPIRFARVLRVYDGDTIFVASLLPHSATVYRFPVRLARVDAPELRTRDAEEKAAAVVSRDALHALLHNSCVELRNVSYDKYGRILAEVWRGSTNVSDWLLAHGLAVPYDGKTKAPFTPPSN